MGLNKKEKAVTGEGAEAHNTPARVTLCVPEVAMGERLDKFLAHALAERGYSREQIKDFIKKGFVLVDTKQIVAANYRLAPESLVHIMLPQEEKIVAKAASLDILYEDALFAIINKPSELTVHPCANQLEETLVHRLLYHFPTLQSVEGERPGIVHRLDKDTTGLLLVALTEGARAHFAKLFAERKVYKEYLALVHGVPQKSEGSINAPIGRDASQKIKMCVTGNGKEALSKYKVLFTDDKKCISLLAVQIVTGRTHQIRVHLEHLGHPILGDFLYSTTQSRAMEKDLAHKGLLVSRPMLHAWRLGFTVPEDLVPEEFLADGLVPEELLPEELLPEELFPEGYIFEEGIKDEQSFKDLPVEKKPEKKAKLKSSQDPAQTNPAEDCVQIFAGSTKSLTKGSAQSSAQSSAKDSYSRIFRHNDWVQKKDDQFFCYCPPPKDFQNSLLHFVDVFLPVVITGLPGCGKSTLLRALQEAGQCVVSADAVVADLYAPEGDGALLLKGRFGQKFIVEDSATLVQGSVNKRKLGEAMMADAQLRKEVEMLIHPLVYHKIYAFWHEQESKGSSHAFAEIPLYFEGQSFSKEIQKAGVSAAYTIGVSCSTATRHKRLLQRGWSPKTIESIDAWHLGNTEKMQQCDTVIDNETISTPPEGLHKAVLHLMSIIDCVHEQKKQKGTRFFEDLWKTPLIDERSDSR